MYSTSGAEPLNHDRQLQEKPGNGTSVVWTSVVSSQGAKPPSLPPPPPTKSGKLSIDNITKFFSLPIAEAASILGVSDSVLKRICRENGIIRWPYRKFLAGKTVEVINKDATREKTKGVDELSRLTKDKVHVSTLSSHSTSPSIAGTLFSVFYSIFQLKDVILFLLRWCETINSLGFNIISCHKLDEELSIGEDNNIWEILVNIECTREFVMKQMNELLTAIREALEHLPIVTLRVQMPYDFFELMVCRGDLLATRGRRALLSMLGEDDNTYYLDSEDSSSFDHIVEREMMTRKKG